MIVVLQQPTFTNKILTNLQTIPNQMGNVLYTMLLLILGSQIPDPPNQVQPSFHSIVPDKVHFSTNYEFVSVYKL